MLDFLIRSLVRFLLWLRYRIRVQGLREVARRGTTGVLFLPNHPALIDPIILMALLNKRFRARALGDQDQIDRPVIRTLAQRAGVLPLPSIAVYGQRVREAVERALAEAAKGLDAGGNLLLYPAGHLQHSMQEDLMGNSGVETVLRGAPNARVVLVRTRGLWGSALSWAKGGPPAVSPTFKKGIASLLLSGIFFAPRRRVTIEFVEPDDFPRNASRDELNRYLEGFYNADACPNTYVPYSLWERGGTRRCPEPQARHMTGDLHAVPAPTRETVMTHLASVTGRTDLHDGQHLARDLGLDSLARTDLLVWLEQEFGFPQGDADALHTVGDVLLAACGETVASQFHELKPIAAAWFRDASGVPLLTSAVGQTIPQVFLHQARRAPRKAILADQLRGVRTFRDTVLSVLVLKPPIQKLEGNRVGILLPASVTASITYLATLFAGKTPVMVNWTLGARNLLHCLDLAGVRRVITSRRLIERLEGQGSDFAGIKDRFVFLEDIAEQVSPLAKLGAFLRSRLCWRSLDRATAPPIAAILLTSGSEALPKAVPLSHANVLENLRSVLSVVGLTENDRLLGPLPPFHAFGLTVTVVGPLCFGLRTAYHPNPTEGAALARLIEAYKTTLVLATPTFLSGILHAAGPEQLASVRLAVTGAEKCPDQLYDTLAQLCPHATLLEGYGVTECSPVITVNDPRAPQRGAIGRLLPSFDRLLVDPENGDLRQPPASGVLLVRGPCVFSGYLHHDGPQPFIRLAGHDWYRTGDVVSEDAAGVMTFHGRLKRFVKRGGEMLSLPAIEAALSPHYAADADEGPVIAVEATDDEANPQIVLFTTREADRQTVNQQLRDAGLSPLHNIRQVIKLDEIPLLGTGKTDYRALKAMLTMAQEPTH